MDQTKYEVKNTGVSAYEGNDIGVYENDKLIRGFNSLSDDYAWTNAIKFMRDYKKNGGGNEG